MVARKKTKRNLAKKGSKGTGKVVETARTTKQKPVGSRGRIFQGFVIKKFQTRAVIEFERPVYIRKYERYYKKKTRLHARIPEGMDVKVGDYVKAQECRPLSKIIHFILLEVVKKADIKEEEKTK